MYEYEISEKLQKIMNKLSKKDNVIYESLLKAIEKIISSYDVSHYKNLKYDMKDSKRVHIGSFVLIFQLDKINNIIRFDDFSHHDNVYSNRKKY